MKIIKAILFLTTVSLNAFNWSDAIEDVVSWSPVGGMVYSLAKDTHKEIISDMDFFNIPSSVESDASSTSIKFEDVIGLEESLQEVKETVEFLKDPSRFTQMGAQLPRGILLEGPPGTGKTLIAKAIAGEANCVFLHASGSEFHKTYVGEGPQAIRSLFNRARQNSPAVIFIDEIDALGSRRSSGDDSAASNEFRAMVNELLSQMDGFTKDSSIVIVGATNLVQNLDPALLRPGRFTRHIRIPMPTKQGRIDIFKYYLKKIPEDRIQKNLTIGEIATKLAERTYNATPAELKNIINEAAILAVRKNTETIKIEHFLEALDRLQLGIKNKSIQTLQQQKITSYHEAGHVLMKLLLKEPVSRVTIIPRGSVLGATFGKETSDLEVSNMTKEDLLNKIMIAQGGGVAEEIYFGKKTLGISDDQKRTDLLARTIVECFGIESFPGVGTFGLSETLKYEIDKHVLTLLSSCQKQTRLSLTRHRTTLDKLANALLASEILDEDAIYSTAGYKKPLP